MLAYIERMNLQPRQVKRAALELGRQASEKPDFVSWQGPDDGHSVSIWRMELPNTSYRAPVAAFWWVSNERHG